jgi:hypothetical protein
MKEQMTFDPTGLPPVCHCCGAGGRHEPHKLIYKHTSANWLSALALLVGMVYYQEMTYTVHLPLCAGCAGNRRLKKLVLFLMWPVVAGLFILAIGYTFEYPELYALPVVATAAGLIYAAVLQRRGHPKAARINNDLLVINVPGYGEVTLFERNPAPRPFGQNPTPRAPAAPPARTRKPAGPQLNRSVCGECGFINFASAFECKKCQAALGSGAAVSAGSGG